MKSIAEIYHESNRLQIDFASKTIEKVKSLFLEKAQCGNHLRLIDIGCGDGRVLKEIFIKNCGLKFSEVVGTDKSTDMVKFACSKYGNDKTNFHLLDIESSCFDENLKAFDVATSYFVFHWIKNYKQAIENVHSFLKPGGIFHLYFVADHSLATFFDELARKYKSMKATINSYYPPMQNDLNFQENFERILSDRGFIIEKGEVIVDFYDFGTIENFKS